MAVRGWRKNDPDLEAGVADDPLCNRIIDNLGGDRRTVWSGAG
jgi:hypothetical protein